MYCIELNLRFTLVLNLLFISTVYFRELYANFAKIYSLQERLGIDSLASIVKKEP